MANQKISQLTAVTTLASGDYFPVVLSSSTTNRRAGIDVLDGRYYSVASGSATNATALVALASGNAALASSATALASGNAALVVGSNASLSAAQKLPLSGGVVSGQFAQNFVPLGLNGSGINTTLGNYFTATLSGNSTVTISGAPSNVAYSFTYEVIHQAGTITWPAAVNWPSATPPSLTTGKTHLFMFVTDDNGTTWRASSLTNYSV